MLPDCYDANEKESCWLASDWHLLLFLALCLILSNDCVISLATGEMEGLN